MDNRSAQTTCNSQTWDDFVATAGDDVGFMQSSWWAEFLQSLGWGHFGASLQHGSDLVGGAQVLVRNLGNNQCYYYIADGPVLPSDPQEAEQVFAMLMAFIERKRQQDSRVVSHLRLESRWTEQPGFLTGFNPQRAWLEPRSTLYVDLTLPEELILAQMKPKGRYNLRVAARHGVRTVEDTSAQGLVDFMEIYEQTEERHGLQAKPRRYFEQLFRLLALPGRGALFFAEHGNVRLAASLVVYFGDRATYLYGGSRAIHREMMAPYALHFESIRQAKAMGLKWYDFYGVSPLGAGHHPWAGISKFKRKFGGVEKQFIATLDRVFDVHAYAAYQQRRRQRDVYRFSASVRISEPAGQTQQP